MASHPQTTLPFNVIRRSVQYHENIGYRHLMDKLYAAKHRLADLDYTREHLRVKMEGRTFLAITESGEPEGAPKGDEIEEKETLHQVMAEKPSVDVYKDSLTLSTGQENVLSLDDFFSRPILLDEFKVTVNTDVTRSIDIWDLYTLNKTVRRKFSNYAYLRAKMEITINVSATPFHYGAVMFSYQPYAEVNVPLSTVSSALLDVNLRTGGLMYLSQGLSKVLLIRDNKPLVMQIPWICPQPMGRLFNHNSSTVILDTTSLDDFKNMGRLYAASVSTIKASSTTPTAVAFQIYGRLTEVELGAPTGTLYSIGTESGDMDERKVGPIEKVASRAVTMFTEFSSVPTIAPYATASAMMAAGIGKFASLLGWSYPVLIDKPIRNRPDGFQNGAQVIGVDTGKRITLDPKQELAIDAMDMGIQKDQLVISEIACRESLFHILSWSVLDDPLNVMMALPVMPVLGFKAPIPLDTYHQTTPLGYAALPFHYWRGDMTFRFEVVCSKYHRGKLAIFYEPNISQSELIANSLDLNRHYCTVIDIQSTQNFEITVEWASNRAWLQVNGSDDIPESYVFFDFNMVDLSPHANGILMVAPYTTLQSQDGTPVTVNCYVHSKNMAFNRLTSINMPVSYPIVTESGDVDDNDTEDLYSMVINPSTATMGRINERFFGENPISFRPLLKRFATTVRVGVVANINSGRKVLEVVSPIFHRRLPISGTNAEYVNLFDHLRFAFLGMRGSVRKRMRTFGNYQRNSMAQVKVSLLPPTTVQPTTTGIYVTPPGLADCDVDGTVTYVPHLNPAIEAEFPFYTNNMWAFSFASEPFPTQVASMQLSASRAHVYEAEGTGTFDALNYVEEFATGEDFNFLYFNGVPPYA